MGRNNSLFRRCSFFATPRVLELGSPKYVNTGRFNSTSAILPGKVELENLPALPRRLLSILRL